MEDNNKRIKRTYNEHVERILMKHFIVFLFTYFLVGCSNNKCNKQSDTDTIFVSGQTVLVAHLDTIELLWRPTSRIKCPPIKAIRAPKKCYALELNILNKNNIKKIKGIEINNNYFRCVPIYNIDSTINVKYIKEYNANVNFKLIEEIKDKYKNNTN